VTPTFMAKSSAGCAAASHSSTCCASRTHYLKAKNPEILAWAAAENRVLITNDRNTMIGFARKRAAAGEPMPGLIVTSNRQSIGSAIDDILLIAEVMPPEEIRQQVVVFLPLAR